MANAFDRITQNPNVLAGRATIRGLRISVAHVINLLANSMTPTQIGGELPDLEEEDVRQALAYAAAVAYEEGKRSTKAVLSMIRLIGDDGDRAATVGTRSTRGGNGVVDRSMARPHFSHRREIRNGDRTLTAARSPSKSEEPL